MCGCVTRRRSSSLPVLSHSLRASTETTTQRVDAATIISSLQTGRLSMSSATTSSRFYCAKKKSTPPERQFGGDSRKAQFWGRRHPCVLFRSWVRLLRLEDGTGALLRCVWGDKIGPTVKPPRRRAAAQGQSPPSTASRTFRAGCSMFGWPGLPFPVLAVGIRWEGWAGRHRFTLLQRQTACPAIHPCYLKVSHPAMFMLLQYLSRIYHIGRTRSIPGRCAQVQ